jgi:replicative DNA helicase
VPRRSAPPRRRAAAPPHSLDAERSALGAILLHPGHLATMTSEIGLRPEDFYRE